MIGGMADAALTDDDYSSNVEDDVPEIHAGDLMPEEADEDA